MSTCARLLGHVAANLRAARAVRGATQKDLADRAGVSRRMVAAIEGGESNVSLATLDRLAAALDLTFADLVREPVSGGVGSAEPVVVWADAAGRSCARVMGSLPAQRAVELWEWSLAPGERYAAEPDRPGMGQLIYVVEGALTLELADGPRRIGPGRALSFPADQPYAYANREEGPLRFIGNSVE